MIKFYNSLSKTKEVFTPISPSKIGMYVCGPTVYDRAHIGNGRAMVIFDTVYRVLCHFYDTSNVHYVRNITDVDDKINARAKEHNIPIDVLTQETINIFHTDMEALGCIPLHTNTPNSHRTEPKATEHIADMIQMCQTLLANKHAYVAEGHVLFDVQSDPKYGHLSRRSQDEMIAGARVEIAPYKKNPADFVLWKPSTKDEPGWDSPWGHGRPGWHIECSAMSTKYLGTTFDLHGGGADLQFPHHENEIAQSCCAYPGSEFARTWIHNGFLTVNGEKMSKSLGNFITVRELLDKGIKGETIRYVLLSTHYRKPLDWSEKAVHDATKALNYFYTALQENHSTSEPDAALLTPYTEALYDDINTPKALAYLHELASQVHKAEGKDKAPYAKALKTCGQLLGLLTYTPTDWFNVSGDHTHIDILITARNQARKDKRWQEADRIRNELAAEGITLKDNPDGTTNWIKQ
jgi:cysteinyl-tRNA synthetase